MLPRLPNTDQIRKAQTLSFGGINRNPAAGDGTIKDTVNMDTDRAPLLSPRKPRQKLAPMPSVQAFGMTVINGDIFWCAKDGNEVKLYKNATAIRTGLEASRKSFAVLNNFLIIYPDRKILNLDELDTRMIFSDDEYMDAAAENVSVIFKDGTIYGETAERNTIELQGNRNWSDYRFKAGDGVTIVTGYQPNNKTLIIREIEGKELRFDEFSFVNTPPNEEPEGHDFDPDPVPETISVTRYVPFMDGIFEHENRLWGWKGRTLYASKLGDPLNFEVYDGLSTDSWTLDVKGPGEITGGVSYLGYPTFFKEDLVMRIYGDKPAAYQLMNMGTLGVRRGCAETLAIAGEHLYYLSNQGMTVFTGGYPQNVHTPFGETVFTEGRACSDGLKYYLCAKDRQNLWRVYVYDTKWDMWFSYAENECLAMAANQRLYGLGFVGGEWCLWTEGKESKPDWATLEDEGKVASKVTFNPFTGANWTAGRNTGQPNRKGTSKLQLRLTLEQGTELTVYMRFDGGPWEKKAELKAPNHMHSFYLPIIPRRSDNYQIEIIGNGDWTLHSLVREEYTGSALH
jgi:hypothetical protein